MIRCKTILLAIVCVVFMMRDGFAVPRFTPGFVPLMYGNRPATDLVKKDGSPLLPEDAHKLATERRLDLSLYNPDGTSELWQDDPYSYFKQNDNIEISKENDTLKYLDIVKSRSGNFRFTIEKAESDGSTKTYTVLLSKNVHNVLLRKNLLRKIGYQVPAIKHVKKAKIKFSNAMEKEVFMQTMLEGTFRNPGWWILNYDDHKKAEVDEDGNETAPAGPLADSDEIELQDFVVMSDQDHIYNLAMGYIPSAVIKGRRVLNSLIIPYALVEIPESANLYHWYAGRVVNKQVKFIMDSSQNFSTTYHDARWIIRRIAKLRRHDYQHIVKHSSYPVEVEKLLVEKMISRRNHLIKLFKLDKEFTDMKYNSDISYGKFLDDGKLTKENWDGYASRFSYGDPESPLSFSEVSSFLTSSAISRAMGAAMGYINSNFLSNNSMLKKAALERQKDLYYQNLLNSIITGTVQKTPLGLWVFPTFGVNIIASRNIVAGSYMGTDNMVQIADTFGVSGNAGIYAKVEGLEQPWSASMRGSLSLTRRYTHLRPIKSFKAALKYPFRNMIVPLLKRKYGHFFDLIKDEKLSGLSEEARAKKINESIKRFKDALQVGESIIITDSLGAGINASVAANDPLKILAAQANIGATNMVLSRLHIHRKDKDTIHVYRDLGNVLSLIMSIKLKLLVPVLDLSATFSRGIARTFYYDININSDEKKNPLIVEKMKALRRVFLKNSTKMLKEVKKPYKLVHHFSEELYKGNMTILRTAKQYSRDRMVLTHPNGDVERTYYMTTEAFRKGLNYEAFIVDSINSVLTDYTEWDVNLQNISNGNPADSFLGNSQTYKVEFESEIVKDKRRYLSRRGEIKEPFAKISKLWRGWVISKKKAQQIIDYINSQYGMNFYPINALGDTEKIFLYNISVDTYIYEKAFKFLREKPLFWLENAFAENSIGRLQRMKRWRIMKHLKAYRKYYAERNYKRAAKYARSVVSKIYRWQTPYGFKKMLGSFENEDGTDNFFTMSSVKGFRDGDENGDEAILSNSLGEVGSNHSLGPIMSIMAKTGMTYGEFYGYWIRGRLH